MFKSQGVLSSYSVLGLHSLGAHSLVQIIFRCFVWRYYFEECQSKWQEKVKENDQILSSYYIFSDYFLERLNSQFTWSVLSPGPTYIGLYNCKFLFGAFVDMY